MQIDRLKSLSTSDLLWAFRRNYPSGVTTFGECISCRQSARAGGFCTACLIAEGDRRGVNLRELDSILFRYALLGLDVELEIGRISEQLNQ